MKGVWDKHGEYAVRRISDHQWVTVLSDYSPDEEKRWVVSYRQAEHMIEVRLDRGEIDLEIVYVGKEKE